MNWARADFGKMGESLSSVDWVRLFRDEVVDDCWGIFKGIALEHIEKYVPRVLCKGKSVTKPWFNKECRESCKSKSRAWRNYLYSGKPSLLSEYIFARSECSRVVRSRRKAYECSLGTKISENPKIFWSYVNSNLTQRPGINSIEKEGRELTEDSEIAEAFSEYFFGVYREEPRDPVPPPPLWSVETTLSSFSVPSREEIEREIDSLKLGKSCGPDDLPAIFLKQLKSVVSLPMYLIFEKSIKSSTFPTEWKRALVCPIHKKGSRSLVSNYRPVSLLSLASKILEKFIYRQLSGVLERNGVLVPEQYGFRPGRSVNLQLVELLNFITRALNEGRSMDVLYLDFEKAFDTVPHRRLLAKLEAVGILGPALKWIGNYLSNRVQVVRVRGSVSNEKRVVSGVPQGSVLGPLLFLVYIADLPRVVSAPNKIRLFADDVKLFREISREEDESELQRSLESVADWSKTWLLRLNLQKCKTVRFGLERGGPRYFLFEGSQRCSIESVPRERDLGVGFDKNLNFRSHIDEKVAVAKRTLAVIRNSFRYINDSTFLLLYKSLVRPHLEYCSPVWNSSLKCVSVQIEKVQRQATRVVTGLRGLSYEDRLRSLKLSSLEFRRRREDIITAFKICKFHPNLRDSMFKFQPREGLRGHEYCFFKERSSTRAFKNFLPNRIFQTWNSFPAHFSHLPDLNGLKRFIGGQFDLSHRTGRTSLRDLVSENRAVVAAAPVEPGARQG